MTIIPDFPLVGGQKYFSYKLENNFYFLMNSILFIYNFICEIL